MSRPSVIGELRESGYQPLSVKAELRKNLIQRIRQDEPIFPGIVGYEESVIPQLESAILSGQDIVLLGERGQAKTRIARSLVELLDPEVPSIAGCEINDGPYEPICLACRERVDADGDDVPIEWISRHQRYGEKLATPDITIADLIGEVDPIRVAEGRYLSDELTIHYGLIPRTNRGIFCINELPDLAERIQVGLLNIMEERDIQIRGYKVRLPLDMYVVASANPEDYTNRGRIITPLKDRFGSQVRTHYPRTIRHEIEIMENERTRFDNDGRDVFVPYFVKEIVAEVTHMARRSGDINQGSGVSVRVSITNLENLVSSALRRSIRLDDEYASPRIGDLGSMIASTQGKIEIESFGENQDEQIIEKLIKGGVVTVFNRYFRVKAFSELLGQFEAGLTFEASDSLPSAVYLGIVNAHPELNQALGKLDVQNNPAGIASAVEFILEGLHLNRKLNKTPGPGPARYSGK